MLQISEDAKILLKDAMEAEKTIDGNVYRLILSDDRLAMALGPIEEGDTVYEQDGVPVLATPTDLAEQLDSTIDVETTPEGARLVLAS
jgi:hypothetical protein